MKDLKGTKTLANLAEAFAGESHAAHQISLLRLPKPKKKGYNQISEIFAETAANEKNTQALVQAHARHPAPPPKTSGRPPTASTANGPICTSAWPMKPTPKGLRRLHA